MAEFSPIIHIGLQKTASTFLQKSIFGSMEDFYTPWGHQSAKAIEYFVLQHSDRLDRKAIRDELKAPRGKVTAISQEDLIGYPIFGRYYAESTIRRISEIIPEARIVLVIREKRSIIHSNYFQSVRQGRTLSISDMLNPKEFRDGFRPIIRLDHFEYDLTYSILRKFFRDDQLLILPYELLKFDKNLFLKKLGDFCGVDIKPDVGSMPVHKRRGVTAMRVERILNRIAPNPTHLPEEYHNYPIRVRSRNRIVNLVNRLSTHIDRKSNHLQYLQDKIEHHLGKYYEESNMRMSEILQLDLKDLNYRVSE